MFEAGVLGARDISHSESWEEKIFQASKQVDPSHSQRSKLIF